MSIKFLGDEEAMEYVYDKLDSNEYWILAGLINDGNLVSMIKKIEDEFFPPQTSLNKEFEIMTGSYFTIAAFTKKRISKEELRYITGYDVPEESPMLFPTTVENFQKCKELQEWMFPFLTKIAQKRNSKISDK